MTKTTNYQLPKWEKTDRIQMKDFNDMTATLDAALKANADAIAETAAAFPLVKIKEVTLGAALCRPYRLPADAHSGRRSRDPVFGCRDALSRAGACGRSLPL